MYLAYSILAALGFLLASPYFFAKGLRTRKYFSSFGARFGRVPEDVQKAAAACIWMHAVSVGEVLAALPLARQLKRQFPGKPLIISTTTDTGQKLARERFDFADGFLYFPFDWIWVVRRVLRALTPFCVVILETEIWPNFLREAKREGVPVIFVNGRISNRSIGRYRRLLKSFGFALKGFFRDVLSSSTLFLMQSEKDSARIIELGAQPDRAIVTGNLKYDSPLPTESDFGKWLSAAVDANARRPLIIAGSVTQGEEPLVLEAFAVLQRAMPSAFLVLGPRKPERFDAAARLIEESNRGYLRRSQINAASKDGPLLANPTSILLLDSIGELAGLYRFADAVFVGGSLVPAGGHNILEPASFGKPPVFGNSMENFAEVAAAFVSRGAGIRVNNPEELGPAWIHLVQDPEKSSAMGAAARAIVEENRGATEKTIAHIKDILQSRNTERGAK
ncbi:MAG TPA: 3-deoxy-D-manno-octulosonic acid transferase [Candidatus Acidoferrum sp.]|nr:3-deoxy-D-manno-octulosonic acid transferase [Candidatus Acidoferrum sp.]